MFCVRKGVRGPVADESDATPRHEGDDDAKTEKKDETDPVGSRLKTVGARMDSINAFGCDWERWGQWGKREEGSQRG